MRLIESKTTAWIAMVLVVVLVVMAVICQLPWWDFIAIFFCFIGIFCHLSSLYLKRMSVHAASKLETIAIVCLILTVIGMVAIYFISNVYLEEV